MDSNRQKVVILGSGCAGLTAAIYLARAGLTPIVLDGDLPGGQLTRTSFVENYPGFPSGIGGYELIAMMRKQAERFGATFIGDVAKKIYAEGDLKVVECGNGELRCSELVIATGSSPMELSVPGEAEYGCGGGVSSCATCDGPFYRGKTVAVVGGGNSAVAEALYLSNICKEVYLIHRREELRATRTSGEKVFARKNIIPLLNRTVVSIDGDGKKVSSLTLCNATNNEKSTLQCDGVFVSIGHRPNSDFARGFLEMDEQGYFVSSAEDPVLSSAAGVFIAGDCVERNYRQAIIAAGSGARAAIAIESKRSCATHKEIREGRCRWAGQMRS